MNSETLRRQLTEISDLAPNKRGYAFEKVIVELFGSENFQVTPNAGAARPRQVDLMAARGLDRYIIECKWRSAKADIDDLDSLRSRLRRTSGAIGLLVSYQGFTGSVLSDVIVNARQPVLLMSGSELNGIANGNGNLLGLLHRKKDSLLTDGKVLLDEKPGKTRKSSRRRTPLPTSSKQFLFPDGTRHNTLACGGSFGQFVFASEVSDIDWVPAEGNGVSLDISPGVLSQKSLIELMERLANMGWATSRSHWTFQQSTRNWHGHGAEEFLATLPKWGDRFKIDAPHHSEEISYYDRCEGGFYSLAISMAAHASRQATMASLSFQLPGIPLDTAPFIQLCRAIGVHTATHFRPRERKSVSRLHLPENLILEEPLALVVEPGDAMDLPGLEWVTGLVAQNPYRVRNLPFDREDLRGALYEALVESEYLICSLRGWHSVGDKPKNYYIQSIEQASSTDVTLCRIVAGWKN
jgi:hypothetical protein